MQQLRLKHTVQYLKGVEAPFQLKQPLNVLTNGSPALAGGEVQGCLGNSNNPRLRIFGPELAINVNKRYQAHPTGTKALITSNEAQSLLDESV